MAAPLIADRYPTRSLIDCFPPRSVIFCAIIQRVDGQKKSRGAEMWILRIVLAFIGAVIVTTVLGAVFHTQFILARLVDMGIDIPFAERWSTTLHDIGGMAPLFGVVIALGFLVAFIAGALVY